MKPKCYLAVFFLIGGYFSSFSLAQGISGGQTSALTCPAESRSEHNHCSKLYQRSSYLVYSDWDYSHTYTPTPGQLAMAQTDVEGYLAAVKQDRRHVGPHRYISVETLPPTKKQLDDYRKNWANARADARFQGTVPPWSQIHPQQLRCMMVFDTQTRQFVPGCYVVGSEPVIGDVAKFDTVSAEFVGQGT